MVLIREEAFVYILIICIRLNRKYHLQLTNGVEFLGEGPGDTVAVLSQVLDTSSALWVSEHPRFLKVATPLFTFSGGLGYALNHYDVAGM